jgi:hypothetical protein
MLKMKSMLPIILTALVIINVAMSYKIPVTARRMFPTSCLQTIDQSSNNDQNQYELDLSNKLTNLRLRYKINSQQRRVWYDEGLTKNRMILKNFSSFGLKKLKNIVLSSLKMANHVDDDLQYFATWALTSAVVKKYDGWTPHSATIRLDGLEAGSEVSSGAALSTFMAYMVKMITPMLLFIGEKANRAADIAFDVQDKFQNVANTIKPSEDQESSWVLDIDTTLMMESITPTLHLIGEKANAAVDVAFDIQDEFQNISNAIQMSDDKEPGWAPDETSTREESELEQPSRLGAAFSKKFALAAASFSSVGKAIMDYPNV